MALAKANLNPLRACVRNVHLDLRQPLDGVAGRTGRRLADDSVVNQALKIFLPIVFVLDQNRSGRPAAAKITGGLAGTVGNETRSESDENSQA